MSDKNIQVLLIEDSIDDADLLKVFLSRAQDPTFSLKHVQMLSEGLACLQKEHFDIVLLDLGLPDSQGMEALLTVRKHAERIPIIVLTGLDDEEVALKALHMDIQDYLIKGQINRSLLKRSIRYAIERNQAVEELQDSEARFRAFFESAGAGAAQADPSTCRFLDVNKRLCDITGYSREELLTMTFRDITHPDDREADENNFTNLTSGETSGLTEEKRYIRKDGQVVWVSVSAALIRDAYGKPVRTSAVIQDITEQKRAEQSLRFSERRFKFTMEAAELGVWDLNLSDFSIWRSHRYDQIFGYQEPLPIWTFETFLEHVSPEDRKRVEGTFQEALVESHEWNIEFRIQRTDGAVRWIWASGRTLDDEQGGPKRMLGIVRDITTQRQLEDEIKHMAQHDALTGLPNRRLFQEIIAVEAAQAKRYRKKLAILYLDLDHFKDINDSLGHEAGDELLKEAARKLRSTIRASDTAARIGGDEFNVLLADFTQIEDISEVVRKIVDCCRLPFLIAGHEVTVTASVGISIYPDDSEEIDDLLRYADRAMYLAKEQGRNSYQFYAAADNVRSPERVKLEDMLRQSLARDWKKAKGMRDIITHHYFDIDAETIYTVCSEHIPEMKTVMVRILADCEKG